MTDADPTHSAVDTPEAQYVAVRVQGADFGLPVERVREVLRPPALTRLPFPPPSVLGVAGVRGSVLPVVDLGDRLLGRPADREGRLVVVADPGGGGDVALLVDSVPGMVAAQAPRAAPPEVEASLPPGWIRGVLSAPDGRLVAVLDLASVLALTESPDKETR